MDSQRQLEPEQRLTKEEICQHRRVLELHTNDPRTGTCPICRVPACREWCTSFDILAAAGQLMAEPGRWEQYSEQSRWSPR